MVKHTNLRGAAIFGAILLCALLFAGLVVLPIGAEGIAGGFAEGGYDRTPESAADVPDSGLNGNSLVDSNVPNPASGNLFDDDGANGTNIPSDSNGVIAGDDHGSGSVYANDGTPDGTTSGIVTNAQENAAGNGDDGTTGFVGILVAIIIAIAVILLIIALMPRKKPE